MHSLGGLIGASLASAPAPDAAPSVRSVVAVYWGACAALAVLCLLFLSFGDASVGLILLALALPAVQIAASLVTVLVVAVGSFDDKKQCLAKIGMITGATIVGTLLGLAVTIPLLLGLAG